jgi:hypothetical protein
MRGLYFCFWLASCLPVVATIFMAQLAPALALHFYVSKALVSLPYSTKSLRVAHF